MAEVLKKETMKVTIVMKDYQIEGDIQTREGYKGRLSDLMNEERRFLNISDAEVTSFIDRSRKKIKFLCISKESIILIYPTE